jgi:outer membrane beta-barrel protein
MRTQNAIVAMLFISLVSGEVYAQASQYQRAKKRTESAPPVATPSNSVGAAAPVANKASDKVDISDLEQKYWAPKDVEFSVVQNRLYSKAKRFAVTPHIGPLVTDSFSSGMVYGLTTGYYFSERHGVEVTYDYYKLENSTVLQGYINQNAVQPDFNRQKDFFGLSYNWVPLYAKASLLDKEIIYYDLSISPGIGYQRYTQQVEGDDGEVKGSPTLTLDIGQHFFLSRNLALRFDVRNRFYNDQVVKYRTQGGKTKGEPIKEKGNHSVTVQFGLTYYFGFGGE